jgi:membrane-associated protease RseP (regulator of RpoE activity)
MHSSARVRFGFPTVATVAALAAASFSVPLAAAETAPPARSHLLPVSEMVASTTSAHGLGMTLSRASPVLRRQLALTRGAGLVVDAVTPGSAAARAGFEPHDVVVGLDDQLLVLPEQLDALLEAAEPGDPLSCTVLRGGRELSLPLSGRPAVAAAPVRSLRPTASSLALVQPPATAAGHAAADSLRRLSDETLLREDEDYRIRLCRGDETRLTVADRHGQVVFDEAIDLPAARDRVPEPVRGRVAEMVRLLEPRSNSLPPAPRAAERIGRLDLPPVELR